MARLPEVGSAHITNPYVKATYKFKFGDRVIEKADGDAFGIVGNWETCMANSQEALGAIVYSQAWMYDKNRFTLSEQLRELALTRIGWLVECQFVYSQRLKIARATGLSEEKIQAVKCWPVFDGWTREERAVLGFTDAVVTTNGRMADELFDALKETLTNQQIVDLVWCTNLYIGLAKVTRILKVEFDDRPEPIVEVPARPGFVPRVPVLDFSHMENNSGGR